MGLRRVRRSKREPGYLAVRAAKERARERLMTKEHPQ